MSATLIHGNKQVQPATIQDSNIAAVGTPAGYLGIATAKLQEGPLFIKSDGLIPMAAALKMSSGSPTAPAGNTNFIQCLTDPVNAQDAATKAYVDGKIAGGVVASMTANVLATANVTQTGTQSIDGVALIAGNTVLCNGQTTPALNGVWVVASGAWTRHASMDNWSEVPGMLVSVLQGTSGHDTVWLSTADPGGTLGTTAITFVQIPGPSDVLAGAGLTRTGQTIDLVAADASLTVNPDNVGVKLDGSRAITLLGTGIGCNVDNATVVISSNTLTVKPNLFLSASNCTIRETPTGAVDGVNAVFTLLVAPNPANTELIHLNGILLEPGAGNDYTIAGASITFATAPPVGSRIKANYFNRGIPYS